MAQTQIKIMHCKADTKERTWLYNRKYWNIKTGKLIPRLKKWVLKQIPKNEHKLTVGYIEILDQKFQTQIKTMHCNTHIKERTWIFPQSWDQKAQQQQNKYPMQSHKYGLGRVVCPKPHPYLVKVDRLFPIDPQLE